MSTPKREIEFSFPFEDYPRILLAHGGGGKLMHSLIRDMIARAFLNPDLNVEHDSAELELPIGRIAYTTDTFVVNPPFFPGGDIGKLAIYGTVNDLAMSGAVPKFISIGFILEEGLKTEMLWDVCLSMRQASIEAGVRIVTGDTKVVEHGKCDQIYINTSGIGFMSHEIKINPYQIQSGDRILVNGDLGRHGMAVMSVREGLEFESEIRTDCAPLAGCINAMLEAGIEIHCLRDLTRGGLASALVELAQSSGYAFKLEEQAIPVNKPVQAACDILGIDPIYVANEGRFVAFVKPDHADTVIELIYSSNPDFRAAIIGEVQESPAKTVLMRNKFGIERIVDMLSGEQLPRIC